MTLKRRIEPEATFMTRGFDFRSILDRAFDALRQRDEATQNAVARGILDFIGTLPEPCEEEADEVDEELEYLTSMTDEQYRALQQCLLKRYSELFTVADIKADTMET